MIKKGFMLLLFVLSITLLTGCDLLNSDIRLFKETYENMKDAKNYEMKLVAVEGDDDWTTVGHVDLESDTVGNVKFINEEDGSSIYFEINGDEATSYRNVNSRWTKEQTRNEGKFAQPFSFLNYVDYSFLINEDIEYEQLKDEDGFKVYKVSILKDTLLPIKYIFDEASQLTEEDFSNLISLVDCEVTIDTKEKLVKKIEFDLEEFVKEYKKLVPDNNIGNEEDIYLTIEFSKFNDVEVYITNEMKNSQ